MRSRAGQELGNLITFSDTEATMQTPTSCQTDTIMVNNTSAESTSSPTDSSQRLDVHHYQNLLKELTLEEKICLLSGTSFTSTTGIPRLKIPALKVSDSINGVRGSQSHIEDQGTACFPSTTCLASTWNRSLLQDFGEEVGLQAKLKSVQIVLGPNVNLHRDPRGGRNFETFSEDPLLTGLLAASIVNGLQSTGVGACAKHFVCNESETMRHKYNVSLSRSSRAIRELYMRVFQYMLRESNPVSIMMAYNKIDGEYCSQTSLIREVLRSSWKYDGCIMSDWYGTHTCTEALLAGLDLEMPGPSVFRGQKLLAQVVSGKIDESYVDSAAYSVLGMIDKTLESHRSEPERTVVHERTNHMALRVAAEGIVLLKNDRNTLPLDTRAGPTIALIGPGARVPVVSGGGSACAKPQYFKSMLDCLKSYHPLINVKYAQGYSSDYCIPIVPVEMMQTRSGSHGADVNFYNNGTTKPVCSETIDAPQLVMLGRLRPGLHESGFHFVIHTTLTVKSSGMYHLGAQVTGNFCLKVDGSEILSGTAPNITVEELLFEPKKLERTTTIYLEADKPYRIHLLVQSRKSPGNGEPTPHAAKLVLQKSFDDRNSIAEAVLLASESDVSVIVAGRTHEHESEGFDLKDLDMDPVQQRLITAVSAVARRTILVLHHGNPIDLSPVIDHVDAIIAAHFPGQEGAQAVTDLILGHSNPSGRLATTWPMKMDANCVPSFRNFPCTNTLQPEIEYAEGLQLGYRNPFANITSRFPFGYGLSYSTFVVSQFRVFARPEQSISTSGRKITAQIILCNTGPFPGHHVVQLYVKPPQMHSPTRSKATDQKQPWRPRRELVAFSKPYLAVGESQVVEMELFEKDMISIWDERTRSWQSHSGIYTFMIADNAIEETDCQVDVVINRNEITWHGLW